MKLFIVDDDKIARIALQDILSQIAELTVIQAENGKEALRLLQDGLHPDLCLFDIRMPLLNGLTLVQMIREDSVLHDLKIAMASSSHNQGAIAALKELGICGYLFKPYEPEQVLALVDRVIGSSHPNTPSLT